MKIKIAKTWVTRILGENGDRLKLFFNKDNITFQIHDNMQGSVDIVLSKSDLLLILDYLTQKYSKKYKVNKNLKAIEFNDDTSRLTLGYTNYGNPYREGTFFNACLNREFYGIFLVSSSAIILMTEIKRWIEDLST